MTSSIEFHFQAIFRRELGNSSGVLGGLRSQILAIAEGRRKDSVCRWWLTKIEKKSQEFLLSQEVSVLKGTCFFGVSSLFFSSLL